MRFNIVVIPTSTQDARNLINLAKHVSKKADVPTPYLLQHPDSIPHASVFQFKIEEGSPLLHTFTADKEKFFASTWQHVSESWQEVLAESGSDPEALSCTLPTKINYKYDATGAFAGTTWAELVLDKKQNAFLQRFHDKLLKRLPPLGIEICNAHGERYNPHFTLFNTKAQLPADILREVPISDQHNLGSLTLKPAFGTADDQWQFTKIIKEEDLLSAPKNLAVIDSKNSVSFTPYRQMLAFMSFSSIPEKKLNPPTNPAAIVSTQTFTTPDDIKNTAAASLRSSVDVITAALSIAVATQPYFVHLLPWNKPTPLSAIKMARLTEMRAELNALAKQFSLIQQSRTAQIGANEDEFADIAALFKLANHLLDNALRLQKLSSSDFSAIQSYIARIHDAIPKLQNPILEYDLGESLHCNRPI